MNYMYINKHWLIVTVLIFSEEEEATAVEECTNMIKGLRQYTFTAELLIQG